MMKNKNVGSYLTIISAILAIVSLVLYNSVPNKMNITYGFLVAAIIVGVAGFFLAGVKVAGMDIGACAPIINAVLFGAAAVWGTNLMVAEIGYVATSLDPFSALYEWIYFMIPTCIGWVLCMVTAFLPMSKEA